MMSTNTMSGWWSAILASASKPSIAVKTSHPSFDSSVSAVRRIVLLSSMTRTLSPWSFVLVAVTLGKLLRYDGPARTPRGAYAARVLTYRYTPGYATRVTFLEAREGTGTPLRRRGRHIRARLSIIGP